MFQTLYIQFLDKNIRNKAKFAALEKAVSYPARGAIYDRNGQLIVYNNPVYDIEATYKKIDPKMDTLRFCELLGIDKATFITGLNKDWSNKQFSKSKPFPFIKGVSVTQFAKFQEMMHEFPGFSANLRYIRGYPRPIAAHVMGYISEVDPGEIEKSNGVYERGDYKGTSGIERAYESQLKGTKGWKYLLKDNLGVTVGSYQNGIQDSAAISGDELVVSLDADLQAYGEKLMQNKLGSIVAIEPSTGEILCLVSAPTYDPNLLTVDRDRGKYFSSLLQDTLKPLFDRTVQAQYPPGSIFKTVVALAGMQMGVINPDAGIYCNGSYMMGRVYKCTHVHGHVPNVQEAISHSCNIYFYQKIQDIMNKYGSNNPGKGIDEFAEYMRQFGLGRTLGMDYFNELTGTIPSDAYYTRLYKTSSWKAAYEISIGIGQGVIQLTPAQMANLCAAIANRGSWITPHFYKGKYKDQKFYPQTKFVEPHQIAIDKAKFEIVIDGMSRAVISGTSRVAAIKDIEVCGKTGTAQNPHGLDHSVFCAFAPRDNPKIAIAVIVENSGFGATYAAPIASLLMEKYIKGQIDSSRLWLETRTMEQDLIHKNAIAAKP
ncbi:MAG: penicillin-binding protein 2 [Saprospiraceae bacterium]|nr:penicillin-binding protein 2 [Saprospiraceae bacterium]MBK7435322.1 penicillin-binding protein 2 [Saprospiraceae bacterium]MBK7607700.1 penicillin-binding protein 2 [Saprospiraceae bacterium]MBK8282256.1 penicillin-binding protein 2 [Saprospiraceae bacterium]MBK8510926.1 penicillin-binding protein 2 [Saprospiraceae bacterium]